MQLKVDQICQNERIEVGRLGENDANRISFDFTAWVESYGAGNITLLFQRPTEELIYPITLSVDGTTATWTVSETDTAISGKAHATLIYTVDEVVKKSAEFFCMIEKVLSANGQTPEPYEDYLAQIVAAGAAAEEAAGIAEDAKDAIENMTASATGLPAGAAPTVDKTTIGGVVNLDFGIPKGEKGERGEQGPRGIQGATGAAATVDVFGTETIEPNEDARVENIGDANHALLVFRIPRGATGATGAQGERGAQGTRGSLWYVGLAPTLDLMPPPQDGDIFLCNGYDVDYPAGEVYAFVNGAWSADPDGSIRGAQGIQGIQGEQGIQGAQGERGEGVPSGGTNGQILRRDTSAADGSVWQSVDASPTASSTNLVSSGGVAAALSAKVDVQDYSPDAASVYMTLPVGKTADGKLATLPSFWRQRYTLLKKIVIGYYLTDEEPADWATNYTDYYTNGGTADVPVYTAVTGEHAPTWEADTYYFYSSAVVSSVSAVTLSSPTTSLVVKIDAAAHTGGSGVTIAAAVDKSSNYKYVVATQTIQAIATEARTSYAYFFAGSNIPLIASQVGNGAFTLSAGRVATSSGALAVQSDTGTSFQRVTFALSNGIAAGSIIEIWGCTF